MRPTILSRCALWCCSFHELNGSWRFCNYELHQCSFHCHHEVLDEEDDEYHLGYRWRRNGPNRSYPDSRWRRCIFASASRKSDRSFIGEFLPDLFRVEYQFFLHHSNSSEDGQQECFYCAKLSIAMDFASVQSILSWNHGILILVGTIENSIKILFDTSLSRVVCGPRNALSVTQFCRAEHHEVAPFWSGLREYPVAIFESVGWNRLQHLLHEFANTEVLCLCHNCVWQSRHSKVNVYFLALCDQSDGLSTHWSPRSYMICVSVFVCVFVLIWTFNRHWHATLHKSPRSYVGAFATKQDTFVDFLSKRTGWLLTLNKSHRSNNWIFGFGLGWLGVFTNSSNFWTLVWIVFFLPASKVACVSLSLHIVRWNSLRMISRWIKRRKLFPQTFPFVSLVQLLSMFPHIHFSPVC